VKLSPNRQIAIIYLILAANPIGILIILLQYSTPSEMWLARSVSIFPFSLAAIGAATLLLAAMCFPDRNYSPSQWLKILVAGVGLSILAAVTISWIFGFFDLWPIWFIWRRYRRTLEGRA
jgi:hypothetical protein